jgi:multisubunit Na+/H+ antiporter MnhF subunit
MGMPELDDMMYSMYASSIGFVPSVTLPSIQPSLEAVLLLLGTGANMPDRLVNINAHNTKTASMLMQ